MKPAVGERIVAGVGVAVGLAMVLMKILPGIPGRFDRYEWLALGVWIALGAALGWRGLSTGEAE
jgi:hypothetical protein